MRIVKHGSLGAIAIAIVCVPGLAACGGGGHDAGKQASNGSGSQTQTVPRRGFAGREKAIADAHGICRRLTLERHAGRDTQGLSERLRGCDETRDNALRELRDSQRP